MQTDSNVIPFNRSEREAQKRMTGDKGDYFRTTAMQDEFRRRWNVAQQRLAK